MARPQSREADNRARSGRPNRSGGKPSTGQQISRFLFGPSDPRVSQAGVGGYRNAIIKGVQSVINNQAKNAGRGVGDAAFNIKASQIMNKPLNMGNQIKGTRSTIYTSGGAFPGKGSFLKTPPRSVEQALGTQQAQITRAAKEAARIERGAIAGAKIGIKKGLKAGGAIGGAAGGAAGYQMGKRSNKKKGSGTTGRK